MACSHPLHTPANRGQGRSACVYAVIEVAGERALEVFGKQMAKMRRVLAKKCLDEGPGGEVVGGKDGKAGRMRLGLMLEKWEREGKLSSIGRDVGA